MNLSEGRDIKSENQSAGSQYVIYAKVFQWEI